MSNDLTYLRQPPFDTLTDSERQHLSQHSQIVYLDSQQTLPTDWQGDFFIIIKGQLHQFQGDELIAGLNIADWFDTKDRDGKHFHFVTQQQSLLYRINGKVLGEITEQNPQLKNALFADLSARLSHHQARQAQSESQQLLYQPIATMGSHIKPPHFVEDTATLYEATVAMTQHDAKHILVKSTMRISDSERDKLIAQGVAKADIAEFIPRIGMFTQTDICRAIGEKADFATTPVLKYTNFKLRTIHAGQDVSEALLTMLHSRIHRLPIIDQQGEIVGVLGQTELLNYLTNHSHLIVARIEQAQTLEEVTQAVDMIGKFIRQQQQNGIKTHVISRMVQGLNLHVFDRTWQLLVPTLTYHNTCLLVMGSEGRGEQIMRTDQDNALIIRNGFKDDNLLSYAEAFNTALADMGYPLCDGNIMLKNERWRKTVTAFEKQISQWLASGSSEDMMWFATLVDAHVVCGDAKLFEQLRQHWQIALKSATSSNFLNRFAKPMLQFGDSGGFWQKFTGGQDNDIDLKKAGIFPIVHGVRTLALEHGIEATNTRTRLQLLGEKNAIDKTTAQNVAEALDFLMAKRLEVSLNTADKSARKVNPNQLSALEKDLLKESLAIVKDFKGFITHHYRLDIF
ncbi:MULTISPECIES: DUF294 nucleotidyltransferase-like domain-containing protein [unclassified Moraxella]|uniref:DUF294 nucleotidyltransferase-like domain-containing protein n=1 Tax=unclassified Moraxella TaxID=2685852 RepID=UPI003AF85282